VRLPSEPALVVYMVTLHSIHATQLLIQGSKLMVEQSQQWRSNHLVSEFIIIRLTTHRCIWKLSRVHADSLPDDAYFPQEGNLLAGLS